MTSPWSLFKESIRIFISNFKYLLKFWLVKVALTLPVVILVAVVAIISVWPIYNSSSRALADPSQFLNLIYIAIPIAIGWFILALWLGSASLVQAYSISLSTPVPIKSLLSQGWKLVWKMTFTGLLAGLAVVGGFLLFFVPGLIFAIWFSFITQIIIVENLSGTQALSRSKQLVKGRFWKAAWYIGFPGLLIMAYSFGVSGIAQFLDGSAKSIFEAGTSLLTLPYNLVYLIYSFLVYKEFAK